MCRLIEEIVRSGLVTAWRFASCPTSRSPVFVKATTEGVVRDAFGVGDDGGRSALHHGDDGIGRAEVDADHFSHVYFSLSEPRTNLSRRLRSSCVGLAAYLATRID